MITIRAEELKKLLAADTTSSWAYEGLDIDFTQIQTNTMPHTTPKYPKKVRAEFYYFKYTYNPDTTPSTIQVPQVVKSMLTFEVELAGWADQAKIPLTEFIEKWKEKGVHEFVPGEMVPFSQLLKVEYKYLPRE